MKMPTAQDFTDLALSAYNTVTGPLPIVGSAIDLAEDYRKSCDTPHAQVDSLIRWQTTKAAHNGFWLGLPGAFAMPVTIPTDIAQVVYLQLRMVAAIAYLYGHDIKSDQIRTCALVCLCGSKATDVLAGAGIKFGRKMAINIIKSISGETIKTINKAVGMRLVTKFGEKGIINLGKLAPGFGGIFGAAFNGFGTYGVGKVAKMLLENDK